jgi:hypothetical protein
MLYMPARYFTLSHEPSWSKTARGVDIPRGTPGSEGSTFLLVA